MKDAVSCEALFRSKYPYPRARTRLGIFHAGGTAAPFSGTLTDNTVATILQNRPGCANAITLEGGSTPVAGTPYSAIFPNNKIPTSCFDPVALSLLQYLPGSGGTSSLAQDVSKATDRGDQFPVHFDHILNKDQKLSVYYYYNNDNTLDPFAIFQLAGASLGNFGGRIISHVQQVNASHTWTIGSTAVNEFRFTLFREAEPQFYTPTVTNLVTASCGTGAARRRFASRVRPTHHWSTPTEILLGRQQIPICRCVPANSDAEFTRDSVRSLKACRFVTLGGTTGLFGNNFEGQLPQTGNTFQFSDNYSKIVGSHSFKFGADTRYQKFDQTVYFNVNGEYILGSGGSNDTGSADPYANFLWVCQPRIRKAPATRNWFAALRSISSPRTVGRLSLTSRSTTVCGGR